MKPTRHLSLIMPLLALSMCASGAVVEGPVAAPVPTGAPSRMPPTRNNTRFGWLTHGQNPKRRSLAERKQRRAVRRQRGQR